MNAIAPGPIDTEKTREHHAAYVTGDVLTIDGGGWLEPGMFR